MKNAIYGAALLLPTGNAASAQSSTPVVPASDWQQQLFNQDVSAYVSEGVYALPSQQIQMSNIAWQKRMWRDIDARKLENRAFDKLATVLVEGFLKGAYKAYSAADDRFTTELTREQFNELLTSRGFNPATVNKYRIKEDWLFLKNENRLEVRIFGIAPIRESSTSDGPALPQPAFWLYYPDTRNFLAQQKVVSKETPYILNWDKLMEGRHFNSDIDKVITK